MDVLIQLIPFALLFAGAVGIGMAVRRLSRSQRSAWQHWSRRPWLTFLAALLVAVPFSLLLTVSWPITLPLFLVAFASATLGLRLARAQSRLHYWGVLAGGVVLIYLNRAVLELATGQQVRTLLTTPFILLPLALSTRVASAGGVRPEDLPPPESTASQSPSVPNPGMQRTRCARR